MLKHKNIGLFSILVLSMGLVACQPQQAEPKAEPEKATKPAPDLSAKLIGDAEKLKIQLPECDGKSCPEISLDRLNSNQSFIDEFIDQQILQQLGAMLSVEPEQKKANLAASEAQVASEAKSLADVQTPQVKMQQQLAPYLQAFVALDKELKNLSSAQKISLMIKPKILNSGEPIATVVLNSSSYLGGAHGASAQQYYNFDLKSKKLVTLDALLLAKQKPRLEQLAHEAFKTWVIDAKLADNVQDYEQAWKFKLSDNYYLSKEGLILQYGEYDIGPYVVGLPRLTIPYAQLETVLKAQYLPAKVETVASEAQPKPASK
ncbi:DUF3298 domain-containing protein [Acinetobacter cumulans]|uniref:DUF3298 domain-containing protein n=1 Tax=Acinetobacter cumulans TaxID=2136182 RepID=A0A3A8G4F1_9GAMM|nr:RsiV family protein [Acinetobacter cumulans]RKG54022.1 DUF3298 domain-containing protein [Acinetobacter cumulans]